MFRSLTPNFAQIRQEIGEVVTHLFNVIRQNACHCTKCHETCGVLISSALIFMKIVHTAWSPRKALSFLLLTNGRNALRVFMVARRHIDGCSSGRQSPAVAIECLELACGM